MIAHTRTTASRSLSTYNSGQPYRAARGRYAPRSRVEDQLQSSAPVVEGRPTAGEFLRKIVRELRIRFYQPQTIKNYRNALRSFLRWYGGPPHRVTREDVREFLLYLVDAGAGSSWVSTHLSAIRTAFDKMCHRQVTSGLATPRRPKKLPVVLSVQEVQRLLEAAPTLRDKLLLGLMYATGMRVSEVVRLRWRDIDFDRRLVNVWQGKGRSDRQVMLPETFEPLLRHLSERFTGDDYIFPAEKATAGAQPQAARRHLSPRTAERVMERAVRIAGIKKKATPHTLRHSFVCHTYEYTCDLRKIQQILGHVHLETTTIYVRVAKPTDGQAVTSPLDVMTRNQATRAQSDRAKMPSIGRLRIHLKPESNGKPGARKAKVTLSIKTDASPVYLTGIVATEVRRGWVNLQIPPLEQWEEPMRWLTRVQRERIEEAAFYELLQQEVPKRLLQLAPE